MLVVYNLWNFSLVFFGIFFKTAPGSALFTGLENSKHPLGLPTDNALVEMTWEDLYKHEIRISSSPSNELWDLNFGLMVWGGSTKLICSELTDVQSIMPVVL